MTSDQEPLVPMHAADIVGTESLDGTAMLVLAVGTPCSAGTERAGAPAPAEELGDEKVQVGQEKDGEGCNSLEGGAGGQGPRANNGIHGVDEGSVAVADIAASGLHLDVDNGEVVPNGDMNMDSIHGLDLSTGKAGDGGGAADRAGHERGHRQIEGDRVRDGDRAVAGKMCGTDDETASGSVNDHTDQSRAPHGGKTSADNDAKATDFERRIRNIEKNMELVLRKRGKRTTGKKGNTGKGEASRTGLSAPCMTVAARIYGNTPQRSERHWIENRALVQELVRLIVVLICCTVTIVALLR